VGFPSADNVGVIDSNLLTLSTSTINGNLAVTTSGLIDQNAPLTVAGPTTLAAGATNDITLDDVANDWSTVAITSADDVSIGDANALAIGTTAVGDDLILNADGALTQTGGATVLGQTSATGAPVTLDHSANDFGGAVAITSSGANAAAVADANDLTLDSSSSGGGLTTTVGDDLSVPAGETIAATGALRLVADNDNPAPPAIGTGGITVGSGAALTGSGAIRLYAARRGDNSIAGTATFNGSTFSPGTLFAHSARERWGVYSPGGTATAPFTFFYKDADPTPPRARITSPADDATYERNQVVYAAYSCNDGLGSGTGVTKCEGPVPNGSPIDTATLGEHAFTVEVENGAGNKNRETVVYMVVDTKRPTVAIRTPAHGAIYTLGQQVPADYACADETALVSCTASVPDGAAIDTSSIGVKTFTVGAADGSGNTASATATYVVENPPSPCEVVAKGTNAGDTLTGTIRGDALFGLAGDDGISGRAGDDCLRGSTGNDRLLGRQGNDRLWGGAGADRLKGGGGDDRLKGGPGDNSYSGRGGDDEILARNGAAEVVRCGRGQDVATIDRDDRTRGCERIGKVPGA
jgi:Ca2+-binding RTX toxin-like protein